MKKISRTPKMITMAVLIALVGYSTAARLSKGSSIPTTFIESDSNIEETALELETEAELE